MEYIGHDLKTFMKATKLPFSQSEIKCLMLQLLQCVKFLHENRIIHRDLKTSNLLLNDRGKLKIRRSRSHLSRKPDTNLAPEILLGATQYSTAIDMWSTGCIMAEMMSVDPLFNGKTEAHQIDKIFRILGTPNETIWPGFSVLPRANKFKFSKQYKQNNFLRKMFPATSFMGLPVLSDAGFDLLNKFLTYDPEKRITVDAALNHEWFREVPLAKPNELMPVFPAQDAQDHTPKAKQGGEATGDRFG
ncbi:cyclin-dependent kinase G-2-like [Lycium ferocissimum]|uniref:cyclin-dependent kinase G-2-like n=1 Tax=Lycium ferocissimum TaxID=112874 RepID=UPI0028155191|nr:cyclin-dependent kinase G-2-like [Lycium ferocissimum]